ncbi:two-component sensor histidine kinase [Mycobacterium sp. MS1601]|uniref:sensor histidine kinase n=1 Tax=Mycobacterium sp. MS1601 TaxID=1936029 RepID=UPI00097949D5|nr:HAMP domain-containing sensor histidine kinase [Mycobacterium sp. MS1601]AQA05064.1 two-component sensor histidine kinase [Mycobacterium sp. MS1601]
MKRSTIRWRLALLYGGAFFLAGAVLVALMYFNLAQSMDRRPGAAVQGLVRQFLSRNELPDKPLANDLFSAIVAQAEQERRETLRTMLVWSLVSLGATGIAAVGFGWLMAGRALAPLQDITATARRVADRNLHERIALRGPDDEIKDLADTFDAMLERLDRAFDGQRRFVANASHELRTPLTINRTLIEVALDDPDVSEDTRRLGATLLQVNQRNERLIDGLITLASSEEGLAQRVPVDLAEVVQRAVAIAQPEADRVGVEVSVSTSDVTALGDPVLLERLAQNLVDNAIRHNTSRSGWVRVTVRDGAQLTVENSGPVIPAAAVDGLLEPFRRWGGDRIAESGDNSTARGAGLGLSIVRSIVRAHQGSLRVTARAEGGLAVSVALPAQ